MATLLKQYNNVTNLKIYRVSGQIIDGNTRQTSHTDISGGGGYIKNGVAYIDPISSSTVHSTTHDIFLRNENGKEIHQHITDELSHTQFRAGHFLDIYYIEGKFYDETAFTVLNRQQAVIYNRNLNKYYETNFFNHLAKFNTAQATRGSVDIPVYLGIVLLPTAIVFGSAFGGMIYLWNFLYHLDKYVDSDTLISLADTIRNYMNDLMLMPFGGYVMIAIISFFALLPTVITFRWLSKRNRRRADQLKTSFNTCKDAREVIFNDMRQNML